MTPEKLNIFGTQINNLNYDEIKNQLVSFVKSGKFHHIVTPNTEMIMIPKDNNSFREISDEADLAVADGVGVVWAVKMLWPSSVVEKFSGSDIAEFLYEYCAKNDKSILLLNRDDGLSKTAAKIAANNLKKIYPSLDIYGLDVDPGSFSANEIKNPADVILVGFGAPLQDIWIQKNKKDLSSIGIVMGAGATIDFAAGIQKRAPKFMQKIGLEWLWRLVLQPKRILRQIKIPFFILNVLIAKIGLRSKTLR